MKHNHTASLDLELLGELGFGPETQLMNEPRLFVDRHFLATLILELEEEFDGDTVRNLLFQIGLIHGFRDAHRLVQGEFLALPQHGNPQPSRGESPPLAIRLGSRVDHETTGCIEIPGCWPEQFEADVRRARIGPSPAPTCHLSAGYTSGWLSGILDANILALETNCGACSEDSCRFVAREVEGWHDAGDPWIDSLLGSLPFDRLRALVAGGPATETTAAAAAAKLDPDSTDVHVWGPVMVLPFASPEGALDAVERLGRDSDTASIQVVILDLRQRIIDEVFDATALEAVVAAVESWGAEVIITGVSPLSEATVAGLEASHLLMRKTLAEAVAAAFQVADAQRHLL